MLEMSKKIAPSEGAGSPPKLPQPARVFSPEYKIRILSELETARSSGHFGATAAILRREGLARNQVAKWERQRDEALAPQKRGRKKTRSPEADELARLRRENERLQSRLA